MCVFVCVSLVGEFMMRHFRSVWARTQNVIFTLHLHWTLFTLSCGSFQPLLFTMAHLTVQLCLCTLAYSNTCLKSASFNHQPAASLKLCMSQEPLGGEQFTGKITILSLICCRIPVPWKMPPFCQRFSSGGLLGKTFPKKTLIFRLWLTHCTSSVFLFTKNCVFCCGLCIWIMSVLFSQACSQRVSHTIGSRRPVDTEGGGYVRKDHLWPATRLDDWVCKNSKVRTTDYWYQAV